MSDDMQRRKTNLEYMHTVEEVKDALAVGTIQAAVVLTGTTMEQLRRTAEAGVHFLEKSTYFYPKLLSGLVFRDFMN